MIFLLYGKDEYRLSQKLDSIKQEYAKKYGSSLSFERIDLAENDEKLFWSYLNQGSLFVSKKLIVVENSFLNQGFKKSFLKKAKEISRLEHILIFIEKKEIKATDSFFMFLKENGKVQDFPILAGKKLEDWVRNLFTQFGSNISDKALQSLLQYTGKDLWLLSNESKKLSAFKKEISEKDIDLLVKPNLEVEIFKTIDALVLRNKKEALIALQRFIDSGGNLFYLLSMVAYQMRNLLTVKLAQGNNGGLPRTLEMHPFVFRKSAEMVKNISTEQLKSAMQNVFIADLKRKTGQESPEGIIRSLILSM